MSRLFVCTIWAPSRAGPVDHYKPLWFRAGRDGIRWDAYGAAVEMRLAERMPHNIANMPLCGNTLDQQAAGQPRKVSGRARIKSGREGHGHREKRQ